MTKWLMLAAILIVSTASSRAEDKPADCSGKLGVERIAEVDTTGGALFGVQYPKTTLLQKGEVVLTFDDGPHHADTKEILAALAAQCTKATFFNVGEMVKEYPDMVREVEAQGHTIGTHTWSHPNLAAMPIEKAIKQIESTFAIEERTLKNGVAPFFRFPYLNDPKPVRDYLASRNIAVFSIDVDSSDWRTRSPVRIVDNVMNGLQHTGGGIILFHDIHEQTVKALPTVLEQLKIKGYKVVHLVPKVHVEAIAIAEPEKSEPQRQARLFRSRRRPH